MKTNSMRKASWILGLTLLVGISAAPESGAATLVATQDNFIVDGTKASVNQSATAAALQVSAQGPAVVTGSLSPTSVADRKSYIGFSLNGTLSAGQQYSNASLSLVTYIAPAASSSEVVTLDVYGITGAANSWTDSTLTWNNAPQNDTNSGTGVLSAGTTLVGTLTFDLSTITAGQTLTLNSAALTTYLNWAAGDLGDYYGTGVTSLSTPSLILAYASGTPASYATMLFDSVDNTNAARRPELSYSLEEVPEPGISLLFMMAGGFLLVRRLWARAVSSSL